jgi:hypothetical protein
VLSVVPQQQLTARIMSVVMSYVLSPQADATRLLLKIAMPRGRWYAPALAVGDWPMARRQLKNFKQLAEASWMSEAGPG